MRMIDENKRMFLSQLLGLFDIVDEYDIRNEESIETLALASAKVDMRYCTFLDSEKYIGQLTENARMIFTTKAIADNNDLGGRGVCVVDNPRVCFFKLHNAMQKHSEYRRKKITTRIGEGSNIHPTACVAENNVRIGKNVIIEEFVSIKENTTICDNAIIRAHTVIGGEGFEHKRSSKGIFSVKHLGGVIIGPDAELQQCDCVDKAIYPWDDTVIGESSKLDNMVHVAHAVKLGKGCFVAASTCIAGRVETGDRVWIGPGCTIINGIEIGDDAKISLGSVVTKSVRQGERVTGNFAIEHDRFMPIVKKMSKGEL